MSSVASRMDRRFASTLEAAHAAVDETGSMAREVLAYLDGVSDMEEKRAPSCTRRGSQLENWYRAGFLSPAVSTTRPSSAASARSAPSSAAHLAKTLHSRSDLAARISQLKQSLHSPSMKTPVPTPSTTARTPELARHVREATLLRDEARLARQQAARGAVRPQGEHGEVSELELLRATCERQHATIEHLVRMRWVEQEEARGAVRRAESATLGGTSTIARLQAEASPARPSTSMPRVTFSAHSVARSRPGSCLPPGTSAAGCDRC